MLRVFITVVLHHPGDRKEPSLRLRWRKYIVSTVTDWMFWLNGVIWGKTAPEKYSLSGNELLWNQYLSVLQDGQTKSSAASVILHYKVSRWIEYFLKCWFNCTWLEKLQCGDGARLAMSSAPIVGKQQCTCPKASGIQSLWYKFDAKWGSLPVDICS